VLLQQLTCAAFVYNEEVLPLINFAHKRFLGSVSNMATQSAHALAFHRGLGTPTASASQTPFTKYLDAETIEWYSKIAYAKSNFAVVANGADSGEFSKWVNEFFDDVPATPAEQTKHGMAQTKYIGGEERIAHDSGNAMCIAFPGSSSFTGKFYKPEIAVLGSLLGGQSAVKWSTGFTILGNAATPGTKVKTTSAIYSDAGLLYMNITGSANGVASTAKAAVEAIKKIAAGEISSEQISKAKAAAKFKELEYGQDARAGLELTGNGLLENTQPYQIDEVAKLIDGVSEEAVKSVCSSPLDQDGDLLTQSNRPPSNYWRTRPACLLLETFSCYRTLRRLASRCKYSHVEARLVGRYLWPGARVPLFVIVPDRSIPAICLFTPIS
jgi:ubiquinol-cytochrome c reductase core subunit 2